MTGKEHANGGLSSPGQSTMGITSAFLFGMLKAYATPEKVVPKSREMTRRSDAKSVMGGDILALFYANSIVVEQLQGGDAVCV